MVSGNSMAHVYLGLEARTRRPWPELAAAWEPRTRAAWSHPAIDLLATKQGPSSVEVRRGAHRAEIMVGARGFSYRLHEGNPLGIEPFEDLGDPAVHERTAGSEYPDSVVQLARLVLAERSGDLVVSAAAGWDLRRRYEPIDHVSSHGALQAAHMLVPLVGNRRLSETPRRTADLYPALLNALGIGERR